MPIERNAPLALAYRAARAPYAGTARRRAPDALARARGALETVEFKRLAYLAANPETGDSDAPGGLPIDGAAGHLARSAYVNAKARAGLYASPDAKRYPEPGEAFRDVVAAHDIDGGPDHNGWYCSPERASARDGDGLCWGVVCQLPGRDGMARFVAGYQFGGVDGGPTLDLSTIYASRSDSAWDCPDAKREAARAADSMAEQAAEEELEYQTAWRAGSIYAEAGERLAELRAELRAALAELRAIAARGASETPALCQIMREAIRGKLDERAELQRERERLKAGEAGGLIFYPDARLREAFADGAGI